MPDIDLLRRSERWKQMEIKVPSGKYDTKLTTILGLSDTRRPDHPFKSIKTCPSFLDGNTSAIQSPTPYIMVTVSASAIARNVTAALAAVSTTYKLTDYQGNCVDLENGRTGDSIGIMSRICTGQTNQQVGILI